MESKRYVVWTCEVEEGDNAEPRNWEYTENSGHVFPLQGTIPQ